MRRGFIWIISLITLCISPMKMHGQTYQRLWKQVEEAEKNSLPKTVITLAEQIFGKAQTEKNTGQMFKAYTARSMYRQQLEPDSFYVDLTQLEQWAADTQDHTDCAILHSLIADIYADYASDNRWQLRQRPELTGDAPSDIREWSKNLFVRKVLDNAYAALDDSTLLLATSSMDYRPFVIEGKSSEYYRHDMYHLLAFRATKSLQKIIDLQNKSEVSDAVDTIFSRLIGTYRQKGNSDAVMLATLDSLNWSSNRAKDGYMQQLDKLIAENSDRDVVVEVYLEKINTLTAKSEAVRALALADEVIRKYPRYDRINAVKSVRDDILTPQLSVNVPSFIYPGSEYKINVNHNNISGFTVEYYRVNIPATTYELLRGGINEAFYKKHARNKISSEHISLVRPADYQMKDTTLTLNAPAEGLYMLRIVPDVKPGDIITKMVSATRLKVLSRKLPNNQFEMVVVDAMSGFPVEGARIRLFTVEKGDMVETKTITTGSDGKAVMPWTDRYRYLTVDKGTDTAMLPQYVREGYYTYSNSSNVKRTTQVKLLTDRSLYRPGQTVYVKGIAYNMELDTANVVAGKSFTLRLQDSNLREINKQEVRTNDFGSFTTEIVLPAVGLNGMYVLTTDNGSVNIRVEEYKRPTFDITFNPLTTSYQLGDSVSVEGSVKSFSGVSIGNVPVSYTVKRSLRNWWRGYVVMDDMIASGSVEANDNGEFSIPVTLEPDKDQEADAGFYTYEIEASVTNVAGETQASQTNLVAGNRSLILAVDLSGKVNKDDTIKATVSATNLNGQPVDVAGQYKLYSYTDYKNKVASTDAVFTGSFTAGKEMILDGWKNIPSGAYKLVLSAKDDSGRDATADSEVVLFSIADTRPPVETPIWYYFIEKDFDATHPAEFVFGTSLKDTYVMMDAFSGNQRIESRVLNLSDSIVRFEYPYLPSYGNGVVLTFCFVKDGEVHTKEVRLQKRMPGKKLGMRWDVFRDKLRPGQQEEWKLTILDPQGMPADAEMMAVLYDASLDKIWKNEQTLWFPYARRLPGVSWMDYDPGNNYFSFWFTPKDWKIVPLAYDRFWPGSQNIRGYMPGLLARPKNAVMARGVSLVSDEAMSEEVQLESTRIELSYTPSFDMVMESAGAGAPNESLPPPTADLRTNFNETAFFYPQLRTNEQGGIVLSFTMPESLTQWNFRGYAHTKGMLTGMLNGQATTSKEFMISPNLPRYVRVGDQTSVAASVTNLTDGNISGTVTFTLFDPLTEKVISTQQQAFTTEVGKTGVVNFTFTATDRYDLLGCRIVAEGGSFSDGEQHVLPVLSNKQRITETVAMPVRGNQTREFALDSLFNHNSRTATNRSLTVEFSGNPAWYAVQALPAISLPTNDDAISWATAWYANSLASYIMNAQPRIKTIFDAWKQQGGDKDTFISNLQKNQDVKNILLEESPWLMEATSEEEQMKRVATLFDLNNIRNNNVSALAKLRELQLNSGAWTWYKGMQGNYYITNYIVETLVRYTALTGQEPDKEMLAMKSSALRFMHGKALEAYNQMQQAEKRGNTVTRVSNEIIHYLYVVAISGEKVPDTNQAANTYFLNKLNESITSQSVKEKAMSAIILQKAGRSAQANRFMASLKEHMVQSDELGMYFAFNEGPYRWADFRVPAHVTAMEAFDVVSGDRQTVEEMKLWLLKQKQTQQWDSPVSTVNAVYALLQRGDNLLSNQGDVRITVGGRVLETLSPAQNSIPGTGYIKETFSDDKTLNNARKAVVEKRDAGIAWGAIYAQYEEEISKVTQYGNELNVDKKLYVDRIVDNVRQLVPVTAGSKLAVGDKVISRLTIMLDRAMDFVQLKDQRASCFEPIGSLSGYSWNGGIGYYVAMKDASTNFFFDSLGKGVYVLEYSYRVNRTGTYEAGIATIQSAYAPEYASHSASMKVVAE